ncbi:hypothetical protein B0H13DRAFT_1873342 [Mycena leptocephala]|nr:hypothetical protein B0H13DRAFT_1873342 [Mycena leptocephala]
MTRQSVANLGEFVGTVVKQVIKGTEVGSIRAKPLSSAYIFLRLGQRGTRPALQEESAHSVAQMPPAAVHAVQHEKTGACTAPPRTRSQIPKLPSQRRNPNSKARALAEREGDWNAEARAGHRHERAYTGTARARAGEWRQESGVSGGGQQEGGTSPSVGKATGLRLGRSNSTEGAGIRSEGASLSRDVVKSQEQRFDLRFNMVARLFHEFEDLYESCTKTADEVDPSAPDMKHTDHTSERSEDESDPRTINRIEQAVASQDEALHHGFEDLAESCTKAPDEVDPSACGVPNMEHKASGTKAHDEVEPSALPTAPPITKVC